MLPDAFATIRRRLLGLAPAETSFAKRGFRNGPATLHLEQVGGSFLRGYHAALRENDATDLAARLAETALPLRGFAYEGAAMACCLLDHLTPWRRNRFAEFINGAGHSHLYMAHVGAGWAWARLPWARRNLASQMARLHPLYRWLAVDGYGFHEGYFRWPAYYRNPLQITQMDGYLRHAFAQGFGRSMWFIEGADVEHLALAINDFPASLHSDLWSGAGLACAYAGGATVEAIAFFREAAGPHLPQAAQGAAFAAKTRERAGNPAPHTEIVCRLLCGLEPAAAAKITDNALVELPPDGAEPAYAVWRRRIHERFTAQAKTFTAGGQA
jgi:hypothetical protein